MTRMTFVVYELLSNQSYITVIKYNYLWTCLRIINLYVFLVKLHEKLTFGIRFISELTQSIKSGYGVSILEGTFRNLDRMHFVLEDRWF